MENQDWFRDIENTMADYLNQYMNNNSSPPTGFGNANNNRYYTESRTHEDLSEHRLYLLINEFMQDYYANMRLYQQNMRDVIQLIREFRTIPLRHHPQSNHSFAFNDVNASREESNAAQIPNPLPATGIRNSVPRTTASFTYFIQPVITENEESTRLTNMQIEHAVERIVYDTSLSNSYSENHANTDEVVVDRCPICLEDFQIGEQVLRIRVCGHIFKQPGLFRWFERNNHCPVCRRYVAENQPYTEEPRQTENIQTQPEHPRQETHHQNREINHLLETQVTNPLMREFGNLIQTILQSNRNRTMQNSFFDLSFNHL
jgi:hypothetical protein